MTNVFITSDNIVSPLGITSAKNFEQLTKSVSGVQLQNDTVMSDVPFYAALFSADFHPAQGVTKFEQLLIASVEGALKNSDVDTGDKRTALIISSTKGNISLLETEKESPELQQRIALHTSAKLVASHFNFTTTPIIISNACISGLLAIITGVRLIQSGEYDNLIVTGADVISKFVLSGFQSFQAISAERCKPFDAARKGINLGEGAATVILSAVKKRDSDIKVTGGAVSNDANHISGPSRTGEELYQAIQKAMSDAGLSNDDIDFISAHGTATIYNDEMEAKAINLGGMQHVPVNSLKGFYGHTLGAAGLIETVIAVHSLQQNLIIPSLGYNESGVSKPLNICTKLQPAILNNCLKTASGFGGCNAAVVFSK